jgi:hypothetical protein
VTARVRCRAAIAVLLSTFLYMDLWGRLANGEKADGYVY